MKNKTLDINYFSDIIGDDLEVTFEYWLDLNDHDQSQYFYEIIDIRGNYEITPEVKDEIVDYLNYNLHDIIYDTYL
jgi:hypothetical protein